MPQRSAKPTSKNPGPKGKLNSSLGGFLFNSGVGPEVKTGSTLSPEDQDLANAETNFDTEPGVPNTVEGLKTTPALTVDNKPGWFRNFITQGRAGAQYNQLNNQVKINEYNKAIQQELLHQKLTGEIGLENTRHGNDISEAENKNRLEESLHSSDALRAIKQSRIMTALGQGLSTPEQFDSSLVPLTIAKNQGALNQQNLFNAADATPDMMTARIKDRYANLDKQGIENQNLQARTAETIAETPTKRYLHGATSFIDPLSGDTIGDIAGRPADAFNDAVKGGVSRGNIGGFRAVAGGALGELGNGSNNYNPLVPNSPMRPPGYIQPQPAQPFINQPSPTRPQFNTNQFKQDFGSLLKPFQNIPLFRSANDPNYLMQNDNPVQAQPEVQGPPQPTGEMDIIKYLRSKLTGR